MHALRRFLRRSALLHRWRFAPYATAYAIAKRIVPVRRDRTVFLSDSRAGFSGNFGFLVDELRRQRPDAEIFGLFKPNLGARRRLWDTLRLPWLIASAQTVVLDDFYPLIYPFRLRPETRLLQVWHASGAFKKVGWSRVDLPGGPVQGSLTHRNYTDALVGAETTRANYAEAFGIDVAKVHALGIPRTDVFFDAEVIERTAARIRDRYGIPADRRIAVFAPTFRGNGQLTAYYDLEQIPWEQVLAELGDEWVVLVKMHPFVRDAVIPAGVIDASDERELNDLLMASDVLITDYSSAIFEYALLDRPVVFFCPDIDDYTASRDFYYPFSDFLMGPLVKRGEDLAGAILSARTGPATAAFRERFLSACDGHASERVVREILLRPAVTVDRAALAPGGTPEPTRVTGGMRRQLLTAWAARTGLNLVYAPLKLLPSRRKVVMISREHPTEPEDFADLRAALAALDPRIRVVSLVRMVPPGIVGKARYSIHMLSQLYHVATARVLVVDTYAIVASVLRHKTDLTVVQIWHALGAFKKFGLSILGQQEGRDSRLAAAMRMHQGYDLVLTSSEQCRPAYAEAFGTDITRVAVAPLPRVDRLRDPARHARIRERIYARHPHLRDARIALFAPTFRLDGTMTVDVAALSQSLSALGVHTVVKLHPLMHGAFGDEVDTADGFSTQEMLHVADLFITDYSSALYEAAVVGVPSYFLAPDLDEYLSSRNFYLDYRTDLPGPIVRTIEELTSAVSAEAATASDARTFAQRWVEVPGDPSPEAGATPCADAIAQRLRDAAEAPRTRRLP